MKFMSEIALFAISSAFVIFSPAFVNGASISVANAKNTLEWNHLISKRATADTKPTETENDTVINLVEPEHQSEDQVLSPSNDKTVDWQILGGNPGNLNEEMTERRRRRSVVATRVANKLESARQKTEDENRLRTKRDLYRIYDDHRDGDDDIDIDSNGNLELTEKDLENLEKLIRQIQSLNQRENVDEADGDGDDDGGIDINDLAYGEDGTSYFEPDAISPSDDADDENLPLVVQLAEPERQFDDDDDEDEVVDDRDFGPKDKRAYPVSRYGDVDDQRSDDDYWVSPSSTIDDNSDIDESENDDVLDSEESIPSYLIDDDNDDDDEEEEARGIRIDTLKRRIKELAQYINDNYRRR